MKATWKTGLTRRVRIFLTEQLLIFTTLVMRTRLSPGANLQVIVWVSTGHFTVMPSFLNSFTSVTFCCYAAVKVCFQSLNRTDSNDAVFFTPFVENVLIPG